MPRSPYQRKPVKGRSLRDDPPASSKDVTFSEPLRPLPKPKARRGPLKISAGSIVSLLTLYLLFAPITSIGPVSFGPDGTLVPESTPAVPSVDRSPPPAQVEPSPSVADGNTLTAAPEDLASLTELARSRTVTIVCRSDGRFSEWRDAESQVEGETQGSGWPLDPVDLGAAPERGGTLVVTNGHVVADCVENPTVLLDGRGAFAARVRQIDWDPNDSEGPDLAILVVDESIPTLPIARDVSIGQWVMAAGSPVGLSGTVTFGAVANLRGTTVFTDAAIGPGNSGGPLFDSKGRVIGTNKAVYREFESLSIADSIEALCLRLLGCS